MRSASPRFLSGAPESAAGAGVAALIAGSKARVIVLIAPNHGRAETVAGDAVFFAGLRGESLPAPYALPPAAEEGDGSFDADCDLLAVLAALRDPGAPGRTLVAASAESLMRACPERGPTGAAEIVLRSGMRLSPRELAERLRLDFDYDNEALCESPGQFSVRGGIVDVYPLNAHAPVRVDFFGDEIESLRAFDPVTQRSEGEPLAATVIAAPLGKTGTPIPGGLFSHLPEETLFVWTDDSGDAPEGWPRKISSLDRAMLSPLDEAPEWFVSGSKRLVAHEWAAESLEFYAAEHDAEEPERIAEIGRLRTGLLRRLAEWSREGRRVALVCETPGGVERLREIVVESGEFAGREPEFFIARIAGGFALPSGKAAAEFGAPGGLAVCAEHELFARRRQGASASRMRRLAHKSRVGQILDFNELADGDALVHLRHGVCRYRGVTHLEIGGAREEVVSLEFADGVTMHTPLREAHLLSRYVGLTKASPKLAKIGSDGWQKTRRAAESATVDMAADLLRMQAKRAMTPGHAFAPDADTPWLGEFERAFPHRETPDQAKAITDTKADMEKTSPMDRLVCGDVGYGKTEVAIRAAFKAVLGGRQVALLCPTTILAQQHFNTFRDRFANFPVSVELLSRFRTPSARAKIIAKFNDGKIDIVVGTHALLSHAVKPPKLGLAIIDEEHRFGVRHKEAFKRLRENVDVLAMSATPIPRTLHLALMGARDLSVIETAPKERLPIRTIVKAYDRKTVESAIRHEVSRGGQVFYLHNRVDTIDTVASGLRAMMPGLRIAVGHGRMDEEELEEVMTRFVAGDHDVLVCTTIIETGLDIPNCNTLIIEGADRFGLSQLYQLRGRVGRFNRQAYAYLLLHHHASMLDPARRRLGAIRQFNQLGAGFRIAMRDLELRGAGNLLGREQSGHIAGVGFELYCRLLRMSVARLRGEPEAAAIRAEVRLDFVKFSPLPESGAETGEAEPSRADIIATLPPEYIAEVRLRVEAFRKLAMAATVAEVREIGEGLADRFGKLPPAAAAFLAITELRCLAESRGIALVETEDEKLRCKRAFPAPDGSQYLKVGANFPRLEQRDPGKKLLEIRAFLSRQKPV